tara:strand:- start:46 stop:534 length:489 start_codon:yes stop_codon:yes gene_type:complete
MNYLKIAIGVLLALSASRFIPHPPNFTSLIALSFYIPAVFGLRYIPVVVIALLFTDLIIGFHSTMIFTSSSIILIGLISKYFNKSILFRIFGSLTGALIFFLISNFGVWLGGSYGYSLLGIITCYYLAIPFFGYTIISTLIFSVLIETVYRFYQKGFIQIYK